MNTPSTSAVKRPRAAMHENLESPNGSFSRIRRESMAASTPYQPQPSTSSAFQVNDDEAERRSLQRMSMIHNISERTRPIPSETLQESLGNWLRMATENKINTKNVWKIHIIDYLKCLLDQDLENPLIYASSALATSAKVYGLRVDDVYARVLKLAGELGRRNPAELQENSSDQDDDGEGPGDNPEPEQGPKKRAKRKNKKCVIVAPESLIGEPDQIYTDPPLIAELNHRGGDILGVDNMLQLFIPIMDQTSEYKIKEWEATFENDPPLTYRNTNPNANSQKMKCTFEFLSDEEVDKLDLCVEFSKFSMVDQQTDKETSDGIPPGDPNLPPTTDQINAAFDMEAETIPMLLDESLSQPMVNGNDNFSSDDEVAAEEEEVNNEGNGVARPRIQTVESMRPGSVTGASAHLEYSWNTNLENDVWAGPAYWKLKSIQYKIKSRAPVEKQSVPKLARKKSTKQVITDLEYVDPPNLNLRSSVNKLKLATLTTWSSNAKKNLLPEDLHIKAADRMNMTLKVANKILPPERPASNLSVGNMEYNYENLNDSTFCNPIAEEINQDEMHSLSDQGEDIQGPEDLPIMDDPTEPLTDEMYTKDNMVAAPRVISKIFVPYARRAKKVDMKRIKTAMWDTITAGDDTENRQNLDISSVSRNEVVNFDEIQFSEVCRKIPKLLPSEQAYNLSPAIAFFGLLHLANEHDLALIGNADLSDVTIKNG